MTNELTPKVRVVKCPKCREHLLEEANVPLYKCGGCGTILQAKSSRSATRTGPGVLEAGAALNNGSDNVSEDRKSGRSSCSTLKRSKVVELPENDGENGGIDQNTCQESKGEQHETVTSEDEGLKNSLRVQSRPPEVICERPQTILSTTDREDICDQAKCEQYSGELQGYLDDEHPIVSETSSVKNKNEGSEHKLGNCRTNGSDQNKHGDTEGGQHGSVNSEDEGKEDNQNDESTPQQLRFERPEVESFSNENRKNGSDHAEYGECKREYQECINIRRPTAANPSSDIEINVRDENELGDFSGGGNDQKVHDKLWNFEGEQHKTVSSKDKGKGIYGSDESRPQKVKYQRPEVTHFSSKAKEPRSDQDEYGDCIRNRQGEVHIDHTIAANPSPDEKVIASNEHELGSGRRRLLQEFDDLHPVIEHSLNKGNSDGGNQYIRCNGEQIDVSSSGDSGDANLIFEERENIMHQNDCMNCEGAQLGSASQLTSHSESVDCDKYEKSSVLRGASEEDINHDSSLLAGDKSEAKVNNNAEVHSRKSSADRLEVRREVGTPVTAHTQARSTNSSDDLISSPNKELEQSRTRVHSYIRSVETISTAEYGDHSSHLSKYYLGDKNPAKYLNIIGSNVYDGSVSSSHGNGYCQPERHLGPLHTTYEDIPSDTRLRNDNRFIDTRINERSEMQVLTGNSVYISTRKKPSSVMRQPTRDENPEPARYHHPDEHLKMSERGKDSYMSPFYQKDVLSGYESGGPSEFQSIPSQHLPGMPESPEQERMRILQTVQGLLDQLVKTPNLEGISGGGASRENAWRGTNFPMYSDLGEPEVHNFHDFRGQRYPGRYGRGSSLMKEHKFTRIPFSGQVTYDRQYTDHLYLADERYSAPLPSYIPNQNNEMQSIQPGNYSPYSSYVSSPPQFMDSRLLFRSGEVQYDEKTWGNPITNKHSKEKHLSDKRHFLPTAGGAPFITCYRCLNLLQLPAEFLLYQGRFHRLKCGSCSELLKFSIQNQRNLVQYNEYMDSPTNGSDGLNNEANRNNVASTSHVKDIPQNSSTDGKEFRKSCSSEDAVLAASQSLEGKSFGRKFSEKNSLEPERQHKNFVTKESKNKQTNAGRSSLVNHPLSSKPQSSEDRGIAASSSPLHRLMGYSSLRHIIYGSGRKTSPDGSH